MLAGRRGHPDNAPLFHRLVDSPLEEAVARGDRARALAALEETLGGILAPEELAAALDEAWETKREVNLGEGTRGQWALTPSLELPPPIP